MAYHFEKDLKSTFVHAVPVAFLAGIAAWFLGGTLQGFASQTVGQIVLSLVVIVALVGLKKFAKIDDLSFYDIVILLAAITLVGTILTAFVPAASPFILTISNTITVSGLLFTFLYIGIAEAIMTEIH